MISPATLRERLRALFCDFSPASVMTYSAQLIESVACMYGDEGNDEYRLSAMKDASAIRQAVAGMSPSCWKGWPPESSAVLADWYSENGNPTVYAHTDVLVAIGASARGGFITNDAELRHGRTGMLFKCVASGVYSNGSSVHVVGAGGENNVKPGEILEWVNPPIGISPTAIVRSVFGG